MSQTTQMLFVHVPFTSGTNPLLCVLLPPFHTQRNRTESLSNFFQSHIVGIEVSKTDSKGYILPALNFLLLLKKFYFYLFDTFLLIPAGNNDIYEILFSLKLIFMFSCHTKTKIS